MSDPPKANPLASQPGDPRLMEFAARFAGPLPLPQILQGYEQACPGAANRVIEMAEQEAIHRRAQEEKIVDAQIESMRRQFDEARVGQVFAFLIAIVFLGCGTYAVVSGHPVAGSFFSLIGLGGIVTTFIIGRDGQKEVEAPRNEPNSSKQRPGSSKQVQPRAKK